MEDFSSYSIDEQFFAGNAEHVAVGQSYTATMGDLTEVAAMAYGSGIGEGVKGGKGHIGILNGKVIKFNTSAKEYTHKTDKVYSQMMASSNALRIYLLEMGNKANTITDGSEANRLHAKHNDIAFQDFIRKLHDILGVESQEDGDKIKARHDDVGKVILKKGEGLLTRKAAAKAVTLIRDYLRKTTETFSESQLALLNKYDPGKYQNHDLNVWRRVKAMGDLSSHGARDGFAQALAAQRRGGIMDANRNFIRENILKAGNDTCRSFEYPSIYAGAMADSRVSVELNGQRLANLPRQEADKILYFQHARSLCASLREMLLQARQDCDIPHDWLTPDLEGALENALRKVGAFPADGNMGNVNNRLTAEQYRVVLFEMRNALLPHSLGRPAADDTWGKTAWHQVVRALAGKLDSEAYSLPKYTGDAGNYQMYHKNQFEEGVWKVLDPYVANEMVAVDRAIHLKPLAVKADYRPGDLGAKNSAKYQVSLGDNGYVLNRSAVFDKLQQHCQGQSAGYSFAYVLKLFSEKAKVLKDASPAEKSEYLAMLSELKTFLETYLDVVNERARGVNPGAPAKTWENIHADDLYGELAAKIDANAANLSEKLRTELKRALSTVKVRYENHGWTILHNKPSFDVKLKTDYKLNELGAKTVAKYQRQDQGGIVFNDEALRTKIWRDCRGMDFRQAYGLALETFTEKSPSFRGATALQKSEYLLALKQLKASLGEVSVDSLTANAVFDELNAIVENMGIEMGETLAKGLKDVLQAVKSCYGDQQVLPRR